MDIHCDLTRSLTDMIYMGNMGYLLDILVSFLQTEIAQPRVKVEIKLSERLTLDSDLSFKLLDHCPSNILFL